MKNFAAEKLGMQDTEAKPLLGNASINYGGAQLQAPVQLEMIQGPFYEPQHEKRFSGAMSDGLFNCFSDCGTCILGGTLLLQPILVHQIMSRLPLQARMLAPLGIQDPGKSTLVYVISLFFLGPISFHVAEASFVYTLSKAVAYRYNIPDFDGFGHVLKAFFCSCCLLSQMARHVGRAQGFIPVEKLPQAQP